MDETGCIWFIIFRPKQAIAEFDRRFPAQLDYYHKDKPFFLNIQGMARLVIDPEEINGLPPAMGQVDSPERILVCVKITSASYHQRKIHFPKNSLSQLKAYVFSIFESNKQYINLEGSGYLA